MRAPPLQNHTHFIVMISQLPVSETSTLGGDALGLLSRQLAQLLEDLLVFQEHHNKGVARLTALK